MTPTTTSLISLGAALMLSAALHASEQIEISATRILGLDDEPLYLNQPVDIAWARDGRAYILNGGDNTVVILSRDWKPERSFAGKGEAPGELNRPSMLQIIDNRIWVKVPRGAEMYDLDGHYLGLMRLSPDISAVYPWRGGLVGTSSHPEGIGVRCDLRGDVLGRFGPGAPGLRDARDLARGLSWLMLADDGATCVLVDRFEGKAWLVADLAGRGKPLDLGLGSGEFSGEFQFKTVVSDACVDAGGGYYVIHYPRAGSAGYLCHYTVDWAPNGRWRFAADMRPGIVRVSPRGELCLIEEQGSIIHLCDRPPAR